ncbi:MAG: FitA-like ribbon-helix-helix domain-containing protein [Actinomycetes bacterium]
MATIQIRDIPEDVYEGIRERARSAGQSLQAYMRAEVIENQRRRDRTAAMFAELDELMARDRGTGVTTEQIVADIREGRDSR